MPNDVRVCLEQLLCVLQPRVPVPLPKEGTPRASPLSPEVQHKPGSKNFSYKELQGDALLLHRFDFFLYVNLSEFAAVFVPVYTPLTDVHAMHAFLMHSWTSADAACIHCAGLGLEDGIDPTCKEEYLTDDEFIEVRCDASFAYSLVHSRKAVPVHNK